MKWTFSKFGILHHGATLGADLASCGRRIDMVDNAMERVDVARLNPNIEIVS